MKRRPLPDEMRLWARVAATVHPMAGRATPDAAIPPPASPVGRPITPADPVRHPARFVPPAEIEPNRKRSIARDRIEARLDLHGLDQDRARRAL
ncbi:MAG TPA: DNA mismatch repair protein MutS, partial [Caulobacteraceae bacterium]